MHPAEAVMITAVPAPSAGCDNGENERADDAPVLFPGLQLVGTVGRHESGAVLCHAGHAAPAAVICTHIR